MKKIWLMLAAIVCGGVFAAEYTVGSDDLKGDGGWESESIGICSAKKKSFVEGKFTVAQAGEYYFWIRTKNYGQAWRTAEVFVNGQSIGDYGDNFGVNQTRKGWGWTKGKRQVSLNAARKRRQAGLVAHQMPR